MGQGEEGGVCVVVVAAGGPHLSQDEGHHVGGLPVGGVEEVRQRHRGEGRERVRTVQRKVHPLCAPPARCD